MAALNITIPDSSLSVLRRSPTEFVRDMKLAAAMHWYSQGAMSQERAAELAGLNRRDFIRALARENLDVFIVDDESLARELGLAEESE
jgi:predicted HTH domain antitoxin